MHADRSRRPAARRRGGSSRPSQGDRHRRGLARRLSHDHAGVVSTLVALCLPALLIAAAVAIDVGSLMHASRRLQGMADLAALSAVEDLGGAQAAATATVAANPWPDAVATQVVVGAYAPDPTQPSAARFHPGQAGPNAAQVTLTAPARLIFASFILGRSSISLTRVGTAARAQFAAFTIGSGLVSLQGGIANAFLSALTGSQVQLSAVDDNALVQARLQLFPYVSALQTRANLQGASFTQLMNAKIAMPVVLAAAADTLAAEGQPAAAAPMRALSAASGGAGPIQLGGLLGLGPYANQDHVAGASPATISLSAMEFASAALMLSQGQRQVSFDLGAAAPGLADVKVWLAIGQRPVQSPWLQVGDDGTAVVSTAQARLYLDAQITAPASLAPILGATAIDAPLYVQLASAQAKLSSLACSTSSPPGSVTLAVQPSIGELALGRVDPATLTNFSTPVALAPATLVQLDVAQIPVLTATGSATLQIGGQAWQALSFSSAEVQAATLKSVFTTDAVQASAASLLQTASVGVQTGGVDLILDRTLLTQGLQTSLTGAAPSLDQVLDSLEILIGVKLGEADLRIDGLRCNDAALVG